MLLDPLLQHRQERLDRFLVADEVVVDEIDVTAIAQLVEGFQFGQHLIVRLGTRRAAIELDDVAKFAGERATARELHADIQILLELQEVEARDRRLGDVDGKFRRHEQALALALVPRRDEFVDDAFDFAENPKIRAFIAVRTRRCVRSADDDGKTACAAHVDKAQRVQLLHQHAAGHGHIRPGEIALGQFLGIAVDEPHIPGLRQQRSDRDEAERSCGVARADKFAGLRKVPKGFRREFRINHKHVAGARRRRACEFDPLLFQEAHPPRRSA